MTVLPRTATRAAPIGFHLSAGLRALAVAAQDEPLPFAVSMYCGQMVISGRVAPADSFYSVTKPGFTEELRQAVRREVEERDRDVVFARLNPLAQEAFDRAAAAECDAVGDELTLIEVEIYPAVGIQGGDGHSLPVARVPYSSVDLWWVVSGDTIPHEAA
jgi:hypothetical protein